MRISVGELRTRMHNANGSEYCDGLRLKTGLAEMLKGGVTMDVANADQAAIAEKAGAVAVMALERVPAQIRAEGGVARMASPKKISDITDCGVDSRHGEMPHWPFRGGPDPGAIRGRLHRRIRGSHAGRWGPPCRQTCLRGSVCLWCPQFG